MTGQVNVRTHTDTVPAPESGAASVRWAVGRGGEGAPLRCLIARGPVIALRRRRVSINAAVGAVSHDIHMRAGAGVAPAPG